MHLKISSVEWRPFCPGGEDLVKLFSAENLAINCNEIWLKILFQGHNLNMASSKWESFCWKLNRGVENLAINCNEIWLKILFQGHNLNMASSKWESFCWKLNRGVENLAINCNEIWLKILFQGHNLNMASSKWESFCWKLNRGGGVTPTLRQPIYLVTADCWSGSHHLFCSHISLWPGYCQQGVISAINPLFSEKFFEKFTIQHFNLSDISKAPHLRSISIYKQLFQLQSRSETLLRWYIIAIKGPPSCQCISNFCNIWYIQYTICTSNYTYEHKIIKTITILMKMRTLIWIVIIMMKRKKKKGGGGDCLLLISDEWLIYENFSLSSKLLKEAFLIFGRYNNFQLDNFHYNSEYSNFHVIWKTTEWMSI